MSESKIHPTAVIYPGAEVADNVEIGPYSVIGPNVKIAEGNKLGAHCVIEGHTTIGKNNTFYQFASVGADPQDLSYKGEPTRVVIGEGNRFREFVTVHKGTKKDKEVTTIGNNGFFMANSHFAHDVTVGDNVICANLCTFGGHVTIGDNVIIGGSCGFSQFVSVGRNAYIGGASAIDRDIPDFCTAYGNRIRLKGINIIGLKRSGHSKQIVTEVVDFYRTMESSALSPRAFIDHEELMVDYKNNDVIKGIADFIRASEVGLPPFMS
jgi:UDP-N-acetylglucosamine acyltransferase